MEAGSDLLSDNIGEKSTENDDYWEKEKQIKVINLITTMQYRDIKPPLYKSSIMRIHFKSLFTVLYPNRRRYSGNESVLGKRILSTGAVM